MNITDAVFSTLVANLFHFEMGRVKRHEEFIEANREQAIRMLDEDTQKLGQTLPSLLKEYEETVTHLQSLTDQEYQQLKDYLIAGVEEANEVE